MGHETFSARAFTATAKEVAREGGSATHRGEQRHREGKGLDPLVDPKGYGGIRRSISRMDKQGDHFVLNVGWAMLTELRFDTTGSMGGNVDLAFQALPRRYKLLKEVERAPLARYDLQAINSIFGDVSDNYVLCRSQAEMGAKIAEQLRLMVPEKQGGDTPEDPHYGLFGAAYLTAADIVRRGLKSYDFTVTDAPARDRLSSSVLTRVFGDEVFDWVKANGHDIKKSNVPTTKEVVQDLLEIAHAFLIQVGTTEETTEFWTNVYGSERIVTISSVRHLPEVEAAIIGLTEGTLDLQGLESFLVDEAELSEAEAARIKIAVSGIPIGAQAALPGFKDVPLKGARFAKKGDLWPIGFTEGGKPDPAAKKAGGTGAKPKKEMWR